MKLYVIECKTRRAKKWQPLPTACSLIPSYIKKRLVDLQSTAGERMLYRITTYERTKP